MPKVVIQLLSDTEELHAESTVIADAPIEQAERVMAAARWMRLWYPNRHSQPA